jgi:hypothetical protein
VRLLISTILGLIAAALPNDQAAEIESISLPRLQFSGEPARAHTQGLELIGDQYYVTARLENIVPKRALLLRAAPQSARWNMWDITPTNPAGATASLNHPGGFQSDGKRLWIPLAESFAHGQSLVRAYALEHLVPGQPATPEFEFPVADHIGALAVSVNQQLLFGANWDTETVYVWDFGGRLQRTLSGPELRSRNLGATISATVRAGVAVQDWKMVGDHFYVSGLFKDPASATPSPKSRLLVFTRFLQPDFECQTIRLPLHEHTELAQEAMAVTGQFVYYLPEDLASSNRLFRAPMARLLDRHSPRN